MTICNEVDCKKQSIYNTECEKPKYCGIHKHNGMVDVVHPRCIENGCPTARISVFHDQIRYWIDNVPDKTIETVQLFY